MGLFNLDNRVVVVTGGLGQLGWQYTRALLEHGARVAVFDLAESSDPNVDPERLRYFQVDVTERATIEAALADLKPDWGVPFGLVNNAALDSPPHSPPEENGPFETYPGSSWDRVMAVNAKGVFLACQVVGGAMAEAGRGSIINASSIYGVVSPDQRIYEYRRRQGETFFKPVAYTASKSALTGLTRYLAAYWAPRGVRVNNLVLAGVFNHQDPEFLKAYCAKVPLGRMAAEDEYNGAVVFLMSDASSYMTGSELVLDGGFTAW